MADLQVTISATGAAELSTLFSSLEKVSTAATKLAGSGKALEELRKLMVGLGNSGSSLGGLNKAITNLVNEVQALPTQLATVLQNVPQQMRQTGQAAGRALGEGLEQGTVAGVSRARQKVRTEADALRADMEAAARQAVLAATRSAEGAYSTVGAQPRLIRPTLLKLKEQNATLLSEAEKEEAKLQTALQLLEEKAARRDRERTQARWDSYVRGTGALEGFKRGKAQERAAIVTEAAAETERLQAALAALDQRAVQQDQARALRRWASWNRGTDAIGRFKSAKAQERAELLAAAEQESARLQAALQGMDLRSMQQDRERAQRRWDSYVRGAGALDTFKRAEKQKTDAIIAAAQAEQARMEAAFDALARQAKRRVGTAISAPDRGVYTDLRSGKIVQPPAAANEIDPKKADSGTNALLRQKAALDAYIPTGNTAHSLARGMASGFGLLWLTWGNILPLLTTAVLSNGFVAVAKAGADVQHTLTMIASLSQEGTSSMFMLNEQMHSLAKNGPFGPREVAEALKVLTQAGLSADEASKNLGATLNFSMAGMVSIAAAAETLVSVTTAFNMGAVGFSSAGDIITRTAAISKTSVENMSGAFKTASVLNAQYGVSLTDVGVGLAALANLGIEASAAGTALRNMYADLSGRSDKVSKILKEQGIQLRELSTGKFPDVIKVVKELNAALEMKTPVGAQNLLQALASERGAKPIVEMLELLRKLPKDLQAGFGNALNEMRSQIQDAYGTAATVAIAASTTVKNQYASLVASFQSDLVRVFEENEPRLLSAIAAIKQSFLNDGELRTALSWILGAMSRLTQVVVENAKWFLIAGAAWASSRILLAGLSLAKVKLASDAAVAATAVTALAAANTAAAASAGGLATAIGLIGKGLGWLNIILGVATAAWTAYSFAKANANSAQVKAGEFSYDETVKALQDQKSTLEKEIQGLREGKKLFDIQAEKDISDTYQRAAKGISAGRVQMETALAQMVSEASDSHGSLAGASQKQLLLIDRQRAAVEAARKTEKEKLGILANLQEDVLKESRVKAAYVDRDARRVPIGDPNGKPFETPGKPQFKPEQFANYTTDLLRIQKDGHAKRMADLQQQTTFEKQLLDAKHRAALVSDAEFQAQSLAQTIADEQRRLAEIERFRVSSSEDLSSKMTSVVRDAGKVDLSEAAKLEGKAYSDLSPQIQNLVGHYKKLVDAKEALDTQVDTDVSKVNREIAQRRLLNEVDLSGRLKVEGQAYTDLARGMKVNVEAQAARLRTEEEASTMSETVLAGLQARQAFEQEFAPQLAKRVDELQRWRAEEEALAATLNGMQATGEDQGAMAQGLADRYNTVRAAVALLTAELARLRDLQGQGAGAAQITAEVAQARKETLRMRDDLAEGLTKAILSTEKGFKKHWESLRNWLKDLFAKTVLTPVIKQGMGMAMQSLGFSGGSPGFGMGGGSGGFSLGGWGGGSLKNYGVEIGGFDVTGADLAQGMVYLDAFMSAKAGKWGEAIGTAAGTYIGGPIGSLVGKTIGRFVDSVFAGGAGTPHVGGYALADASGKVTDITKQQGGTQQKELQTAMSAISSSLALSFNSVAETFGKEAGVRIRAVFESDGSDPSWGLFHMLQGNATQQMAGSFDALGTLASDPGDGLKEFTTKAATAVRDALVVMDIPEWAKKSLNALGEAVDVDALSQAAKQIAEVQLAFKAFTASLKVYGPAFTGVAAMSVNALDSLAQLAGGLDQLGTSLSTYYEKFYSAEERRANTISYLTEEFNKLGVMPTTMKDFRGLVDQAQGELGTEEGRAKFNTLLRLSDDFASLFAEVADKAAEALAEALASLAQDRSGLEVDLLRAKGDTAEASRLERLAALADLTKDVAEAERAAVVAAYDLNAALRAQIAVAETISGLQGEGRSLQADVLSARGDEAGAQALRRLIDLERLTTGMSETDAARVRVAYDLNEALRAELETLQRVKEALTSLSDESAGLQADLLSAQGRDQEATDLRRLTALQRLTQGMSEADAQRVTAAYDYTEALRLEVAAVLRVREALDSLSDEGAGLQADLLSAQGRDQEATDLRRLTALQRLTQGMAEADADRVTAAYDYTEALKLEVAALLRVKEALANLSDESAGLQADLLSAQGRDQEATDLRRLTALQRLTQGMSEADAARVTAAYDYTEALKLEVASLLRVKEALASLAEESSGLQADLLSAQGRDQEATDLRRLTALQRLTQGMTEADAARVTAAYDYTEALKLEVAAVLRVKEVLEGLSKETSSLEAELLDAKGDKAGAAALRRRTDLADLTRGMTDLDAARVTAAYDYNVSLRESIDALKQVADRAQEVRNRLKDMLLEGGDLSARLLEARGDKTGAAALRRALDLAKMTEGLTEAEAARITAAYDANTALRGLVEIEEELAAKAKEMRSAWQALSKTLMEEVNRIRQGAKTGDEGYAARQAEFSSLLSKAGGGDLDAGQRLVGAGTSLLEAAKDTARTGFEYRVQEAMVALSLESVASSITSRWGSAEKDEEDRAQSRLLLLRQLETAQESGELLVDIQTGMWSAVGILDALKNTLATLPAAALSGASVPQFASGGVHLGGLRLVGELGPELEATGPSRVHSSDSLMRMLKAEPAGTPEESREAANSRSSGADAAAEVRALRDEQRRQSAASVALQLRMTKLLERWEQAGIPETRAA